MFLSVVASRTEWMDVASRCRVHWQWVSHEGGMPNVAQRGFAIRPFEIEHFVCQTQTGSPLGSVDLQLARSRLLG